MVEYSSQNNFIFYHSHMFKVMYRDNSPCYGEWSDWSSYVYTQTITVSEKTFDEIMDKFRTEITLWLPRKHLYINTSWYECFMTQPKVVSYTLIRKIYHITRLNNTQYRFLCKSSLFTYDNNKRIKLDRNTILRFVIDTRVGDNAFK